MILAFNTMNIFNFIDQTIKNGGSSYNPEYGIQPCSGYMVSIKDAIKVKFDNKEETVQDAVHKALTMYGSLLVNSDNFLGSWISDDGHLYIDIAKNVQDIRIAIKLGMLNDQLAIYDLNKERDIKLKTRQKCGTETQKATYIELAIEDTIKENKS